MVTSLFDVDTARVFDQFADVDGWTVVEGWVLLLFLLLFA